MTRSDRVVVVACALALTLATWGYLPFLAVDMPAADWESLVFSACGPFCHQNPARSFHLAARTLPLCARCAGMWLGITLGVAVAMMVPARRRWSIGVPVAVVATLVSGAEALHESTGGAPQPWLRAVFGLCLFLGVTFAVSFDALAAITALRRRRHNSGFESGR